MPTKEYDLERALLDVLRKLNNLCDALGLEYEDDFDITAIEVKYRELERGKNIGTASISKK